MLSARRSTTITHLPVVTTHGVILVDGLGEITIMNKCERDDILNVLSIQAQQQSTSAICPLQSRLAGALGPRVTDSEMPRDTEISKI